MWQGSRDDTGLAHFIDARKLGTMADRTHREMTDTDIATIVGTYHAWRGDMGAGEYADVPGFCMAATLREQQAEAAKLDAAIATNLKELGYGG